MSDTHRSQQPSSHHGNSNRKESASLAVADSMIDHLLDKFATYLIFQKVKQMIVPHVTKEIFRITSTTCNYLSIQRDNKSFSCDEDSETFEAPPVAVDKCTGGDYMKKNVRYLEPEPEVSISHRTHSVDTDKPKGMKRLKKAVNKTQMALALAGGAKKEM